MLSSEVVSQISAMLSNNGEKLLHVVGAAGQCTEPYGPPSIYLNGVLALSETTLRFVGVSEVGRFSKRTEIKVKELFDLEQMSAFRNDSQAAPPKVGFAIESDEYEFIPDWPRGLSKAELIEVLNNWARFVHFLETRVPKS